MLKNGGIHNKMVQPILSPLLGCLVPLHSFQGEKRLFQMLWSEAKIVSFCWGLSLLILADEHHSPRRSSFQRRKTRQKVSVLLAAAGIFSASADAGIQKRNMTRHPSFCVYYDMELTKQERSRIVAIQSSD
jgi:hypothetical protein